MRYLLTLLLCASAFGADEGERSRHTAGLVGRWIVPGWQTGNGAVPTGALDSSGKTLNGTLTGSPSYSANGFTFASGKYLLFGQPSFAANAVGTVTAWVKVTEVGLTYANIRVVYSHGKSNNNSVFSLLCAQGFYSTPDGAAFQQRTDHTNLVFDNKLHFIAWTCDGIEAKYYVDGKQRTLTTDYGSDTNRWFSWTATDNASVGILNRPSLYGQFVGTINRVTVYQRCLTAAEVAAVYKEGLK